MHFSFIMARKISRLHAKLREGAKVHSKAVKIFGKTPEKPIRALFREAVSGVKLTKNQRRYLLETLRNLKGNYALVERASKDLSAADMVSMTFKILGLKPESPKTPLTDAKIQEILEASKGTTGIIAVSSEQIRKQPTLTKGAFGLVLKVDNPTFERLTARWQELGLMVEGNVGGVTTPLVMVDPASGKAAKVALTIMPEEMPASMKEIAESHERKHRESMAFGLQRTFVGPPKTRKEAREHIMKVLQGELASHISQKDPQALIRWLEPFARQNEQMIKSSLTQREIREILDAVDLIQKRALKKIPANELTAIIRTTPVTKLRKRLEGVLKLT